MLLYHYLISQQNGPGLDFKGNRHDMNRDQPGMQQLEVGVDYQFLNFLIMYIHLDNSCCNGE